MSKTNYPGIDYGLGKTNRNTATGIRYGVIHSNAISPDAFEDIVQHGTDVDYKEAVAELKSKLRSVLSDYLSDYKRSKDKPSKLDEAVGSCWEMIADDFDDSYENPGDCTRYWYDREGYKISVASDGDMFIEDSPYFTYAQFCSPCAPGACYLASPLDEPVEANKCYCLAADWFEDNVAPYPVYSVATGKLVASDNSFTK